MLVCHELNVEFAEDTSDISIFLLWRIPRELRKLLKYKNLGMGKLEKPLETRERVVGSLYKWLMVEKSVAHS